MDNYEFQDRATTQPEISLPHSEQGESSRPFSTPPSQPRSRKRKYQPRASQACELCRAKKAKCDQGRPCQICKDREVPCIYNGKSSNATSGNSATDDSFPLNNIPKRQLLAVSPVVRVQDREEKDFLPLGRKSQKQVQERSCDLRDASLVNNDDPTSPELENEMVIAVNEQTSGTEFYGPSSNFVSLNELLSKARQFISTRTTMGVSTEYGLDLDSSLENVDSPNPRLAPSHSTTGNSPGLRQKNTPTDPSKTPLSVVNLLCDETATLPDPRPTSPVTVAGRAQKGTTVAPITSATIRNASPLEENVRQQSEVQEIQARSLGDVQVTAPNSSDCFFGNPMLLEMEYVNLYFHNLHYLYPCLSPENFKLRCEREIWAASALRRLRRNQMHFLALYNAVLAVGSLTAPTDALQIRRAELDARSEDDHRLGRKEGPSSIRLSKLYVQRARRLLGDVFEICSLEGAQTLLLLSIYSQHTLRPHSSYMYSGMAVRTALAIGLPSMNFSRSEESHVSAARTWWCIYYQEIKVSCSCGRLSTLSSPSEYRLPIPPSDADSSNDGPSQTSIISAQVSLSAVLRSASGKLYPPGATFDEKSKDAQQLDEELLAWKSTLPQWLNPDVVSFKETEWANKQKLALNICFHHIRAFIHRPFLSLSSTLNFDNHISTCLLAARTMINILHSAFTHRHYIRSWWYNATQTLYASIILLHVLLLDKPDILLEGACNKAELIEDIYKSLQILRAMDQMAIAVRYADLLGDILEIARQSPSKHQSSHPAGTSTQDIDSSASYGNLMEPQGAGTIGSRGKASSSEQETTVLLPWQPSVLSRDDVLASLMNPNGINNFDTASEDLMFGTVDGWNVVGNVFSDFIFAGENNDTALWDWEHS